MRKKGKIPNPHSTRDQVKANSERLLCQLKMKDLGVIEKPMPFRINRDWQGHPK